MKSVEVQETNQSPELYREIGKSLLNSDKPAQRSAGISNILKAYSGGDPEATYIVGELMLRGVLKPVAGDPEEHALSILCGAAQKGNIQARALLNAHCISRYSKEIQASETKTEPLVDFDGKPIKVKRTGILTPIDAVLEYAAGVNTLTLSANIKFWCDETLNDPESFEKAVLDGIMQWQGEYTVFGNQALRVVLKLTNEERVWDNVIVLPVTDEISEATLKITNAIGTQKNKERVNSIITSKRSFAVQGLRKWSTRSRKLIYVLSESGKFDDFEEIKHVAKHEFGHALGLGDLYESRSDNLGGVSKGTYSELDGFYLTDKFYNLVMCDHHGPISNNDIEMVVLAFRENKAQLYQPGNFKGVISKALGRGN